MRGREHVRTAVKTARRLGGKARYVPRTPHGRIYIESADGRTETMVVSHSPRCMAQAVRILKRRVTKFMEGKPSCSQVAQRNGEKP